MQWINSAGGPLIFGEKHVVTRWLGVYGLSTDSHRRNDYERACSTTEYLERMICADGHVMVLGDEPHQSSFFRNRHGELAIARWVHAGISDNVGKIFQETSVMSALSPPVPFETIDGELVLLDSAARGFEIAGRQTAGIQPGQYLVTTERLQAEGRFSFIVHRLVPA